MWDFGGRVIGFEQHSMTKASNDAASASRVSIRQKMRPPAQDGIRHSCICAAETV
jgi:hypothetical protein